MLLDEISMLHLAGQHSWGNEMKWNDNNHNEITMKNILSLISTTSPLACTRSRCNVKNLYENAYKERDMEGKKKKHENWSQINFEVQCNLLYEIKQFLWLILVHFSRLRGVSQEQQDLIDSVVRVWASQAQNNCLPVKYLQQLYLWSSNIKINCFSNSIPFLMQH